MLNFLLLQKHEIPISAIPCFQYRKELDKEASSLGTSNLDDQNSPVNTDISNGHCPFKEPKSNDTRKDTLNLPISSMYHENNLGSTVELNCQSKSGHTSIIAKVESVKENNKLKLLNFMSVRDYCQKLFEFQEITIRKFK